MNNDLESAEKVVKSHLKTVFKQKVMKTPVFSLSVLFIGFFLITFFQLLTYFKSASNPVFSVSPVDNKILTLSPHF
jgi:hypothetical protein